MASRGLMANGVIILDMTTGFSSFSMDRIKPLGVWLASFTGVIILNHIVVRVRSIASIH